MIVQIMLLVMLIIRMRIWGTLILPFLLFKIMVSNLDIKADTELRLRILPVQSGLWHSLLSAQWPRHSDPPWAAAEHCLVLCWVPLAQVTEQSLQELHSCHCPSTEAPTTTQQACPIWKEKDSRHKCEEIFRSLFFLWVKASPADTKWKAWKLLDLWRMMLIFCSVFFFSQGWNLAKGSSKIIHYKCVWCSH